MGDRIVGTAWRIRHTYSRRPLSTFAATIAAVIAAVIAVRCYLLAARRAGGTRPSEPGVARVGPAGSAQYGGLVKLAMADEPKPRRSRQKMLVLLLRESPPRGCSGPGSANAAASTTSGTTSWRYPGLPRRQLPRQPR
jgi:hypothetical protein